MEEIKIGNQIWMKKNLDVETFRNGDAILHAKTDAEWVRAGDQGRPAWCYYENVELHGEKYGKLYNWFAVNDPRGLAPKGWHVPSDKEWDKLVEYLGGEAVAGERMKTIHGWEENGNGTDQVGFSGLPGGYRAYGGTFDSIGDYGDWWSHTDGGEGSAWFRSLSYGGGDVYKGFSPKESGFSVRCLRD